MCKIDVRISLVSYNAIANAFPDPSKYKRTFCFVCKTDDETIPKRTESVKLSHKPLQEQRHNIYTERKKKRIFTLNNICIKDI